MGELTWSWGLLSATKRPGIMRCLGSHTPSDLSLSLSIYLCLSLFIYFYPSLSSLRIQKLLEMHPSVYQSLRYTINTVPTYSILNTRHSNFVVTFEFVCWLLGIILILFLYESIWRWEGQFSLRKEYWNQFKLNLYFNIYQSFYISFRY